MARVNLDDLDKYNSGGGAKVNFFQLQDDGDTESVRFMFENEKQLSEYVYNTHKVTVGEKAKFPNKHVNCLRSYNDPIEDCPLCAAGEKTSVRVFIPVYNINAEEVQFFDRPKGYIAKLQKLMARYKNFPSHIFDIERNGVKGDKQTTYDFIEVDEDDTTLDDLPEIPDVLGSAIIDATADDMEYYLDNGEFPPSGGRDDDDEDEEPVRRRPSKKKSKPVEEDEDDEPPFDEDEEEERPRRRPARNREDRGRNVSARGGRRSKRNADDEF